MVEPLTLNPLSTAKPRCTASRYPSSYPSWPPLPPPDTHHSPPPCTSPLPLVLLPIPSHPHPIPLTFLSVPLTHPLVPLTHPLITLMPKRLSPISPKTLHSTTCCMRSSTGRTKQVRAQYLQPAWRHAPVLTCLHVASVSCDLRPCIVTRIISSITACTAAWLPGACCSLPGQEST